MNYDGFKIDGYLWHPTLPGVRIGGPTNSPEALRNTEYGRQNELYIDNGQLFQIW